MLRDVSPGDGACVLVVEDDAEIAGLLLELLAREGFRTRHAAKAADVEGRLSDGGVDMVLMDVMLPGGNGLSLCREVRASGGPPVIMVSALGSEAERVAGFEAGADDYVAKPFGTLETMARIRAVLRRGVPRQVAEPEAYRFEGWTLDVSRRTLRDAEGVRMVTTSAEFDLLLAFLRRPGEILSRGRLLELTYVGAAGPDERSVDVHVSRLRQKIEVDPRDPLLIKTVRLGGYVFTAEVSRA